MSAEVCRELFLTDGTHRISDLQVVMRTGMSRGNITSLSWWALRCSLVALETWPQVNNLYGVLAYYSTGHCMHNQSSVLTDCDCRP